MNNGTEGTIGGKSNTTPGQTAVKPADNAPAAVTPGQTTPGQTPAVTTPTADAAEGVDKVKSMMIKASEGGTFVSEDGTLTAVIPPGALSQDTEVRFYPVDTSKAKNSNVYLNGMRFQADLGNAFIMPGKQINVTSKADQRFVGELKSMYADFTAERYNLSQDAKGTWNITMPLMGPALESAAVPAVDPIAGSRRGIMHESSTPLAIKSGGFRKDSRIEAFCDYQPPPPPPPPVPVCANVKWQSDDPDLANQPAFAAPNNHVTVSFGTAATLQTSGFVGNDITGDNFQDAFVIRTFSIAVGPAAVITNAQGRATTWIRQGQQVAIQATTNLPNPTPALRPRSGTGSVASTRAGAGGCVDLTVPKWSPQIKLNLNSAALQMSGGLKVETSLDGDKRDSLSFTANNTSDVTFEFFVRVPDDNTHAFKVDQVILDDFSLVATPQSLEALQNVSIQRNGIYPLRVNMQLNQPK